MSIIKLSKLDVAKRQLDQAIKLYFNDADVVSIHTLVTSSLQVLNDLGEKQGIKTVIESKIISQFKSSKKRDIRNKIREAQNFFKHAETDQEKLLDFDSESTEVFLLDGCLTYEKLVKEKTPYTKLYTIWFYTKNKDMIIDKYYKKNIEEIEKYIKIFNKQEFLIKILPIILLNK